MQLICLPEMLHNLTNTSPSYSAGHFPRHISITSCTFAFKTFLISTSSSNSMNISLRSNCVPGHCIIIWNASSIQCKSHTVHILFIGVRPFSLTSSHFRRLAWHIIRAIFSQMCIISGNLLERAHHDRSLGLEHTRTIRSRSLCSLASRLQ